MKSELRLCDHAVIPDAKVIEVWYAGEFIATVVGADGPGVRVLSKHPMESEYSTPVAGALPGVMRVTIKKTTCDTCKSQPGTSRVDNGLAAGIHCDACWEKLVADARSRGW